MDDLVVTPRDTTSGGSEFDRRQMLKRIGVAGAIVWTAPLLSQAPAYAAGSYCSTTRSLSWNGFGVNPVTFPRTLTFPEDVRLTITETFHGTTTSYGTAGDPDRGVYNTPHGGLPTTAPNNYNGPLLLLWQTARTPGGRRLRFAFTNPTTGAPITVRNVRFWITDIDVENNQYDDQVTIIAQGGAGVPSFVRSNVNNTRIIGTGTQADPFRNNTTGNVGETSSNGTIRVDHAATLTEFTVDFWNGTRETGGRHAIFLSNVTFDSCT